MALNWSPQLINKFEKNYLIEHQDGAEPLHSCTAGQIVQRTDPSCKVDGYNCRSVEDLAELYLITAIAGYHVCVFTRYANLLNKMHRPSISPELFFVPM